MENTWGAIYRKHLARGEDHGSAAYMADQWQKREDQRVEQLHTQQIERDALKKHGLLSSSPKGGPHD